MRLLYALDTYRPNIDGVAISSERIAKGLARRGHTVGVIAPGRRFADYEEAVEGLPVFRVRSLKVFSDRWWVPVMPGNNVERAIAYFRPDVVVVTLPFLLSRAAVGAARRLEVPVVGVTGTMPEWLTANLPLPRGIAERANPALWRHIADYYEQCEAVVGVTQTALRLLQDHGLTRPGYVISNGVSPRRFRPRVRDVDLAARFNVDERPTVLYAGRLDAEKRMDIWLEAAALTRQSGVDAQFLIVGDGSEVKHLAHLAEKLELGDSAKFLGFLDDEDYAGVFSLADVFAIASPAELQSIVTLEAAASGLPVVAVNAGALPELVEDGRNGYLFAVDDAEEMATALQRILSELPAARHMGKHSRMIALEHDIERTVAHYERLFRSISGEAEGSWDGQLPRPASQGYSTTKGA
jgi:glycosyltransferase involved in cell wall biosynthesis